MAVLLGGATGCATVYHSSPGALDGLTYMGASGAPAELIYITTTGYYFLWTIPLVSGDLRWDEKKNTIDGYPCFFRDQVGATELQTALLKIAETRNCDVIDVTYHDSDTSYAGPSYGGGVGVFFGSSQIGISGVLVPRAPKAAVQKGGAK